MKTPMQEVYENFNLMSDKEFKAWMLNTDLLEKEKEVMCEFAFNCGDEIKDQNNWSQVEQKISENLQHTLWAASRQRNTPLIWLRKIACLYEEKRGQKRRSLQKFG